MYTTSTNYIFLHFIHEANHLATSDCLAIYWASLLKKLTTKILQNWKKYDVNQMNWKNV